MISPRLILAIASAIVLSTQVLGQVGIGSSGSTTTGGGSTSGSTTGGGGTTGGITPGGPHYVVTYNGGTWNSTGAAGSISGSDNGGGAGVATGGGTMGSNGIPIFAAGPGTASCTGAITATYTWDNSSNPHEMPPPVAIVLETASASWSGDSGSCADGLGDPPVSNGPNSATSSGHRYTVKNNPGWTFTTTISPSASASFSGTGTYNPPMAAGGASVSYVCNAYPVRIRLVGVEDPDLDKRLMIGQQLVATVDVDMAPTSNNDVYLWSAPSGGSPFADFQASSSASAYTAFTAPANSPSMSCYFAQPAGSITLQCQVTLQGIGLSFPVTETVGTVQPGSTLNIVGPGNAELMNINGQNNILDDVTPNSVALWDATYSGTTWGIWWIGAVLTPTPFSTHGTGQWCFTQCFTSSNRWYHSNGHYYDYSQNFSGGLRCDNSHPYRDLTNPNDTGWFPADNSTNFKNDSPTVPAGLPIDQTYVNDHFETYMFYSAPRTSRLVPLYKFSWDWQGDASYKPKLSKWTFNSRASHLTAPTPLPSHPIWTGTWLNGQNYNLRP